MTETTWNRRKFLKLTGCGAVVALVGAGCSQAGSAEASCPLGFINDPFPGECNRYVDKNGNGICDLSEVAEATTVAAPIAATIETTEAEPAVATDAPTVEATEAASVAATEAPTAAPTEVPPEVVAETGNTLQNNTVICSHGCSYPGHCNRYIDTNGNNICDLTEMTVAQAQAAGGELAAAAASGSSRGGGRRH